MPSPPNRRPPSSHGYRLPIVEQRHPGWEPSDPPPSSFPAEPKTPSRFARAAQLPLPRLLALIAASATGMTATITALSAGVVNVINAWRPASISELRAELESKYEARIHAVEERAKADFGLGPEAEARRKKDDELADDVTKLRGRLETVEAAVPKIQGLRPGSAPQK